MLLSSLPPSLSLALLLLLAVSQLSLAATTEQWKSRSIYQIMTDRFARTDGSTDAKCDTEAGMYCGGSWAGITSKLDYIQGMGFDSIYISPITENLPQTTKYGQAYHGYWPQNIYALNDKFGTEDDLKTLVKACHSRGMFVMVDVVINDMGFSMDKPGTQTSIDYSVMYPFNDASFYHPYCNITDFGNYTDAQVCWLGDDYVALPDLKTEDPRVVSIMGSWAQELVANYSLDGLRVDAAKHVDNNFLGSFAQAAGVFTLGEVYEGDAEKFCPYQELVPSMFNYPIYFPMVQAFTNGNISALSQQMSVTQRRCADSNALASFAENHDVPRFASFTNDSAIIRSAIAFSMLSDGIPTVYAGQEHAFDGKGVPSNREAVWTSNFDTSSEFYKFTALMNKMRRQAIKTNHDFVDYHAYPIYTDDSTIVVRKGFEGRQIVSVLSNQGSAQMQDYNLTVATAYTPGGLVTEITQCKNYTINQYGQLIVPMQSGEPKIFFNAHKMNGSQICNMGNWSSDAYGNSAPSLSSANIWSVAAASAAALVMCLL